MGSIIFFSLGLLVGSVLSNKLLFHRTWKDSIGIGIFTCLIGFVLMLILKLLNII